MSQKQAINCCVWRVLLVSLLAVLVVPTWGDDADTLIKFKLSLSNDAALNNWNNSSPPCIPGSDNPNWTGVRCLKGSVFGLRLENMSLTGLIDMNSLVQLSGLRSLSFMNNSFDGPIPDVKRIGALRTLYLSYNKFSGEISDDAFTGINYLRKVHLERNQFTGKIPTSLASLDKLLELNLQGNQFEGDIPDFGKATQLTTVDFSSNQLVGPIPPSLSRFNASSFAGNKGLCGKPLKACKSSNKNRPDRFLT